MDFGATRHFFNDKAQFIELNEIFTELVNIADNEKNYLSKIKKLSESDLIRSTEQRFFRLKTFIIFLQFA